MGVTRRAPASWPRLTRLAAATVAALALVACGEGAPADAPASVGEVTLAFSLEGAPAGLHHVRVRGLGPGGAEVEQVAEVATARFFLAVRGLVEGTWAFAVSGHAADDAVLLCGVAAVPVVQGYTTGLSLSLSPATACLLAELACDDGEDQDADGLTDCEDPDCSQAFCDDGDACTAGETCGLLGCGGGGAVGCDDDHLCTVDSCDPATGCVNAWQPGCCEVDADCDDGDACTADTCLAGSTCGHAALEGCCNLDSECDDGDPCTEDVCASNHICHPEPIPDCCPPGEVCDCTVGAAQATLVEECGADPDGDGLCYAWDCQEGACVLLENPECCAVNPGCDDGDACTTDFCKGDGICGHVALGCDDGNPCTADTCDPATGCANDADPALEGASCDDGDACTASDACTAGACGGAAVAGCCNLDAECDDGDPCTEDLCASNHVCHADAIPDCCPPGQVCDCTVGAPQATLVEECGEDPDGDGLCYAWDCVEGACVLLENPECCLVNPSCDDGDACTTDFCKGDGICGHVPTACDDGNPCTADACTPGVGCEATADPAADGDPCDDGDLCTQGDACLGGACVASASTACLPLDGCHDAGACDPSTGLCSNPVKDDGSTCEDGDACTVDDACAAGVCEGGGAADCDDGLPCTEDGCSGATGCTHDALSGACDDGDPCTEGDACVGTACLGTPLDCDDGDACTLDACLPGVGCANTPWDGPCSDGDPCTTGEACGPGGACEGGVPTDCSDGDPCTADACVQGAGCVSSAASGDECAGDGACDDGDACTADACLNGVCLHPPVDCRLVLDDACVLAACAGGVCSATGTVDCDDGDPCTVDGCDPAVGCTHAEACGACAGDGDCDDGNPCTVDRCLAGTCVSGAAAEICGNGLDDDCDGATDTACAWRVRVGAPAAGADGKGWATAFPTLGAGLAAASAGDAIWVAAGTYRAATAKATVLTMKAGVALYGGFAGDEASLAHRPDPLAPTVLDGDFDLSGGPTADDSIHVVLGASDARLDGFTVRGGNAPAYSGDGAYGGGLYQAAVSGLVVARCRFSANKAQQGAAFTDLGTAAAGASSATFVDTRFDGNSAIWGGAVRLFGTGTWTFTNCVFDGNAGSSGGGGLWTSQTGGALTVEGGTFIGNTGGGGGALGAQSSAAAISLSGVSFTANVAGDNGGALSFSTSSNVTIAGCVLEGNSSGTGTSLVVGYGGGLYATGSTLAVSDTDFLGNQNAKTDGGGASVHGGAASFTDCWFAGNASVKTAGGLHTNVVSSLALTRVAFTCNTAGTTGGGAVVGSTAGTLSDCTFTDNEANNTAGGLYVVGGGMAITGSRFERNRTTLQGGGGAQLSNTGGSSVRDCTFRDNEAGDLGGGLGLATNTDIPIVNSTFVGNVAVGGGGLFVSGSTPTIAHCSFRGNAGTTEGGGLLARYAAPVVQNSAFFGNVSPALYADLRNGIGGAIAVSTSCFAAGPSGTGNVTLGFADDPFVAGPQGELFLRHAGLDGATATSACVDAGSDAAADAAGLDWSAMTTRSDGALDATPVDAGRHYAP